MFLYTYGEHSQVELAEILGDARSAIYRTIKRQTSKPRNWESGHRGRQFSDAPTQSSSGHPEIPDGH